VLSGRVEGRKKESRKEKIVLRGRAINHSQKKKEQGRRKRREGKQRKSTLNLPKEQRKISPMEVEK